MEIKYRANIIRVALLCAALTVYVHPQTNLRDDVKAKPTEQNASIPARQAKIDRPPSPMKNSVNKELPAQSPVNSKTGINLNNEELKLIDESKSALIKAGISAPYFNNHFKLLKVENKPGDQRVIWEYSVNDYKTLVKDSVGFYTAQNGNRVNIHSISNTFQSAHDINKTIPKTQATKIMKSCLGNYTDESVTFSALPGGNAGLYLTAVTAFKTKSDAKKNEREEKEHKEKQREKHEKTEFGQGDLVEEDEESSGQAIFMGFVNLETGKCSKTRVKTSPRP